MCKHCKHMQLQKIEVYLLPDVSKDGCLSLEEFLTAMHLVVLRRWLKSIAFISEAITDTIKIRIIVTLQSPSGTTFPCPSSSHPVFSRSTFVEQSLQDTLTRCEEGRVIFYIVLIRSLQWVIINLKWK